MPTTTPLADELLIVRCQLGERRAFDELIGRWSGPLSRYLLRVTGNSDTAADLAQDVWLAVLQGIGGLTDRARFRAWLFGIAHRRLADRLRKIYLLPEVADMDVDDIAVDDLLDERASNRDAIDAALLQLPLPERDVLVLFYLQELSLADITSALATPLGTVKSRLFRARANLRQHLVKGNLP